MRARLWLIGLCLYGAAGAADIAIHLRADWRAAHAPGEPGRGVSQIPVAFAAGLFWPADLAAALLLGAR